MMTLTTISEKLSNNAAQVLWRVGTSRKGIVHVNLDFEHDDSALLGELIAIRYLLFEKQVFGREPGGGQGYQLRVSKGAIRKLALGKSDKKHAVKFAAFLPNRMKGVKVEVSQKYEFMPKPGDCEPEIIHGDRQVYARTFDAIETPAMGRLLVTQHAVEQYAERITTGDPKKPWASLVGRLMHPELQKQKLEDRVLRHKLRKYGRVDNLEVWGHPSSSFKYLVIHENGERVLVTVFRRVEI